MNTRSRWPGRLGSDARAAAANDSARDHTLTQGLAHGLGHAHGHGAGPLGLGRWASRAVVIILAAAAAVTAIAIIFLWPGRHTYPIPLELQSAAGGVATYETAKVESVDLAKCLPISPGIVTTAAPVVEPDSSGTCLLSVAKLTSGEDDGKWFVLQSYTNRTPNIISATPDLNEPIRPGPGQPELSAGDEIKVVRATQPGQPAMYAFEDFSRSMSLWIWVTLFGVVIVAVAAWKGLRALIGLTIAFAVLLGFTLPSILDGHAAVGVALASSSVILFLVMYLAHGVSLRTSAALLGTLASLCLCGGLAWAAVNTSQITGLSDDRTTTLQFAAGEISAQGILLAGFIIGSLGVLNDVTITQASTAFELARLAPKSSRRRTFTGAMTVGRDHIASTVYTLVFAYAGSALPLLLLFSMAGRSIGNVMTSDVVAVELVRACVGGIGLALSVPLTTLIAVVLAKPLRRNSSAASDDATHEHPEPVGHSADAHPSTKPPAADSPVTSRGRHSGRHSLG